MKTNRLLIKKHSIAISKLSNPAEILAYFRQHNIHLYVYEIRYLGYILKYGMSAGTPGERLYRQIANCPAGWLQSFRSPSGKDFECVCDDYFERYGVVVDRNNLEVVIHDMTAYKFEYSYNPLLEVKRFEAELIDCFTELHGERPIGNIKAETAALTINATPDAIMDKFFVTV